MTNIIRLLPDSLANQIAAGEVIQRPASVVKELLENSVDAGASKIQLIVKDAGKSLIQVIDNGNGMTETDARMSLERHATSKISKTDDLFDIRTKGFRGEALASIVAVAQMEMKTRTSDSDIAHRLLVEGSVVKEQDVCAAPQGTSIAIKNLFFNIPARRKFLKSDPVEMRHIIDEFHRVALASPDVEFKLHHNEQQLFMLQASNLRQRIMGIFGKTYNEKLVPLEEETELVRLSGFVAKPEAAKKSRGDQYLFVNNRYFKSHYFHSAITQAFEGLIPANQHAAYFIFFEVDPAQIDVNIHPTKTEIKFEDERSIYAILRSVVKRSLGQYHVAPSIDFNLETSFEVPHQRMNQPAVQPEIKVDPTYNPFDHEKKRSPNSSSWERGSSFQKASKDSWKELYATLEEKTETEEPVRMSLDTSDDDALVTFQIGRKFVLIRSDEGVFLLHQYRAHTRILFEEFDAFARSSKPASQQQLFPVTVEFSAHEAEVFEASIQTLSTIGFDIEVFGKSAFIVRGVPTICEGMNIEETIAGFMDDIRNDKPSNAEAFRQKILRSMAQRSAIKSGTSLGAQEMIGLFRNLMRCIQPEIDLGGKSTFVLLNAPQIEKLF